jgi:hypothetical protein
MVLHPFDSPLAALLLVAVAISEQSAAPRPTPAGTAPGVAGALPAASRASLQDHRARPHVFADPGWFQWGGSCVKGEDGRWHLFYSRWPRDNPRGMYGWLYESQIARAVADRPEGPYLHQEVVLEGFGDPQPERWDAVNAHNPCITRMLDPQAGRERYFLYFIANRDDDEAESDWMDRILRQRIGVAVADAIEGPWRRHPAPVCEPNGAARRYVVNPGVCRLPDGRFLMVLKGRGESDGDRLGPMVHAWALAERPTGPFIVQEGLLFPPELRAEDPCVWVQGSHVLAAVKDWRGELSGTPGIAFVRGALEPGGAIRWEVPERCSVSPRELRWDDGEVTALHSLERPFVLLDEDGRPSHLFAAAAVASPFAGARQVPQGAPVPVPDASLPFNVCLPLVARPD